MAILIALYGPQLVGKTTAATSLVEHHKFARVAFADPIYRMLAALLDTTVEAVRRLPKNEPIPELGGQTLRHTMQKLGTEWGRDSIYPALWTDAALRRIAKHLYDGVSVVVDDLRFRNEYEALQTLGCKFVELTRDDLPEQVNGDHISEAAWKAFECHASVINPPDGAADWAKLVGDRILSAVNFSGGVTAVPCRLTQYPPVTSLPG